MRRAHVRNLLAFAVLTSSLAAQGPPLSFEEAYALAPDRAKVVATLIPGTDDFYYYSCRERLDARDFDAVRKILPVWIQRHGRSARVVEIENREALLSYPNDGGRVWAFLRERLGLRFEHQRVVPGAKSDLPTSLDPGLLSPEALTRRALERHPGTVDGFEDRALPGLSATSLDANQLHRLLDRLDRPDVDNLPALIVRDLDHPQSGGFGSMRVHGLLRRAQLEECLRLRPALLQEPRFVQAFLVRLQPGADLAWQRDPAALRAQLARLWEFAQRLPPSFNSLKAHVLFHWLTHDLTQGAPDKDRFLAYLRLPRRGAHASDAPARRNQRDDEWVDAAAAYPTGLPAIGDDEALVRACLERLFETEDGYAPYAEFLQSDWLRAVLAETKILLGQGDPERWYSMLGDPGAISELERRVVIEFARTSRAFYAAGDSVRLDVLVKNVPNLLVKVYAVDTFRFHVETHSDVNASIDLDGIVPTSEEAFTYSDPPVRRVLRSFELPALRDPGTYVVDFVGNGISSRAVVQKGDLRCVERTTAAGHAIRVYDEAGAHRPGASIWFGGREYTPDRDGDILIPFTAAPGGKQLVLHDGNRSTLASFDHRAETYRLFAPVHVDRESLVAGRKARLVIRPQLRLADHAVSVALLQKPVLTIVATDLDGIETVQTIRDLALKDDSDLIHELSVPERLAFLRVGLAGRVKDLADKDVDVQSGAVTFGINGIDAVPATSGVVLVQTTAGYALEIRGKDGEKRPGETVHLGLKHRDYREPVLVSLQTDAAGRAALGPLGGIELVQVRKADGYEGAFRLARRRARVPETLHGLAGETLRLPWRGSAPATREEVSLLGSERDEFAKLAVADGFLELRGLDPGDYELRLRETGETVEVKVTQGVRDGGLLLGRDRALEASESRPLQLRSLAMERDALVVRVANHTKSTRVHVVATRFVPPFDAFANLAGPPAPSDRLTPSGRTPSTYHSGRGLDDEYRYVLERRFATKYPGNMLRRPSLLLNPWAIEDESKNTAGWRGGGGGGPHGGGTPSFGAGVRKPGEPPATPPLPPGAYANVDFLPAGSALLANLTPDADGLVRVNAADLGEGQIVGVVAVDGDQIVADSVLREEKPLQPRARHLIAALDASKHFVDQKRIQFVAASGTAVLDDARSAQVEVYDSLASVHRLLSTLCPDQSLPKFAFVLGWPKLDAAAKRELYDAHACHELDFFLFRKDPEFFAAVVRPFLANKLDKTFLDQWLLGEDLARWLEPWSFAQLNLIEKILLAQRLDPLQQGSVGRLIRERIEIQPPGADRIDRLFRAALGGMSLDLDRSESLRGLMAESRAAMALKAEFAADAPAPAETDALMGKAEEKSVDKDQERARFGDARKRVEELQKRRSVAMLYRAVDRTKVLAEHDYWHRRLDQMTADVVPPNRFWADYATAKTGEPFVSTSVLEASGSFLEAMFALSVLDLPFEPGKHEVVPDGERRTLRAATPLLLVRREVTTAEKAADQAPLMLGENFFRFDERERVENGERRDLFVTDEFLAGVVYGCRIVVTNPTSRDRTVEVLLQIPAGSLPVNRGFWTRSVPVELKPYATATLEYAFYFPASGDFAHYPAHAAEKGKLAASAEARVLHVVPSLSKVDTASWQHVSQEGTPAEVLAHLDTANAQRIELSKVAWRMRDRAFFDALLKMLRSRHLYDDTLWSYAIFHQDPDGAREYLRHADGFLRACGAALRSPLVTIDPKERKEFQHLELDPLVHPRAHRLGNRPSIDNADLAAQYGRVLRVLGYHERLDSADWIVVAYYLLLQDRVEEGLAAFAKVDPSQLTTRLQYDYLTAYAGFFTGDLAGARRTAERYRDYPVEHWKKRFADVLAQLDEAEGRSAPAGERPPVDPAAAAPSLELALEGRQARVAYRNLAECELRYYELDVEFAFSAQPFASDDRRPPAFVRPSHFEIVRLPEAKSELLFELPERFRTKSVLVDVRAKGIVRSQIYFANALDVRFIDSLGQVAVAEPGSGKPLPKTYVKVFAKMPDGAVRFHKDGYTDLRGRFDYASVSDDPDAGSTKYAVLVLSEDRGAVIRELTPPMR